MGQVAKQANGSALVRYGDTVVLVTATAALRTIERQRQLVKSGASQTMNSRHIGGFAVDLVPIVNGKVSWDWRYFYAIAEAVQAAANELGINVRWGGCWEVINNKSGTAKSWVDNYGAERQKLGKKAFTDGPHFELPD